MTNINRIFFDIDETLIHTPYYEPNQDCLSFILEKDMSEMRHLAKRFPLAEEPPTAYYTIVRPCAQRLIDFARSLVGKENVHILTTATRNYAQKVNELAGWGFNNEDIFSREDLEAHSHALVGACGHNSHIYDPHIYAHPKNVIIDNLPKVDNPDKVGFIGIWNKLENYLKIHDYLGENHPDCTFEADVKEFLSKGLTEDWFYFKLHALKWNSIQKKKINQFI